VRAAHGGGLVVARVAEAQLEAALGLHGGYRRRRRGQDRDGRRCRRWSILVRAQHGRGDGGRRGERERPGSPPTDVLDAPVRPKPPDHGPARPRQPAPLAGV
jgi:hypothetical protein